MEDQFYSRENFDMLYAVVSTDINRRLSLNVDDIQINTGKLIYNNMEACWLSKSKLDTVESINKSVLDKCISDIISHIQPSMIADEQVKVFINDNSTTELTSAETSIEDVEGTKLYKEDTPVEPEQSFNESDLDISSGDRRDWGADTKDTPYEFSVNLGASDTFPGISTMMPFKNVVGICITHAIIPDIITNTIDKYPYLYLEIEELKGIYHSTSDHGRRAMVKLIRDKQWNESDTSNVRYNLMNTKGNGAKPSVGWQVKTPLGSLTKLSIRITTPSGMTIKNLQDIFAFTVLTQGNETIVIECRDSFQPNSLHIGNRVGFNMDITDSTELNVFLSENEHEVVGIDGNKVHIAKPVISYDSSGTPSYDTIDDSHFPTQNLCYMMNLSVQSNFGFNIKTVCYDVSEAPKLV